MNILSKYRERIVQIGAGLSTLAVINWLYNYPLWLVVIEWLGPIHGWIWLMVGAIIINRILIHFHAMTELDWTGLDLVERFIRKIIIAFYFRVVFVGETGFLRKILSIFSEKFSSWRRIITFLSLSIFQDSFFAVAYLRTSNGTRRSLIFSKKDWLVFLGSSVIGTAYWTTRQFFLLELTKYSASIFF
ncbi:MAG: hypothetical protein IPN70_00785 [Candidatus Moraniibacteriota bacterium]|nr:MAG: hypothetical protein IPN70_00785 [Candidatus Moranbacteria bacterium]